MPKKELLAYIQKKQHEGKTPDEIMYKLTSHGWPLAEIHEGFNYLATVLSSEPVHSPYEPTYVAQSQYSNDTIVTSRNPLWFFSPTLETGILVALLSIVIGNIVLFLNPAVYQIGVFTITRILSGVIITAASVFLSASMLSLVTRVLSIPGRTFAKSLVFTGSSFSVMLIFSLIILMGAPGFIMLIFSLVFGIWFFWYYYQTTFLKSLAAFALNLIFGLIVVVVLAVLGSILLGFSLF